MPKSKKTVTATTQADAATEADERTRAIAIAIESDITSNLQAKQSGAEVATAFDAALTGINWSAYKGNASAATCEMDGQSYKLVKTIRGKYRDGWNAAGLPNFDQRWKYVQSCSEHYVAPEGGERAVKTTEAKLEEAVRAVLRHATTLGDGDMIEIARGACDYLGLEIKDESEE